ncbi:transglutaminase-like domain-containing protein [Acidovorax sp.]|jgi:transglutaminase-like putative cysteine protease|uniref:transglutaminase-like domain-containing protein n=1 Tax=Acidovorax sp. TaxID=1872122 RepID=UPI00391F836A
MNQTFVKLHATCRMTLFADMDCAVVAMLRPRSGDSQWMVQERYELTPVVPMTEYVDDHGNLCQRLKIPQGQMRIEVDMIMITDTHIAVDASAKAVPVEDLPFEALKYLLQSRYCPSDKMQDKAREIVGDASPGYGQVEAIRSWVHRNLEYRYNVSSGTTDALDTLNDGAGVCRDFSHVAIGLCRALDIPARYVVGYLHALDPMDMHAWFEAFVGDRWYAFDGTQAHARGGRIVVAYGRDAADVAFLSYYGPLEITLMNVRVEEIAMEAPLTFPLRA